MGTAPSAYDLEDPPMTKRKLYREPDTEAAPDR